jgi:hypothetical protein
MFQVGGNSEGPCGLTGGPSLGSEMGPMHFSVFYAPMERTHIEILLIFDFLSFHAFPSSLQETRNDMT